MMIIPKNLTTPAQIKEWQQINQLIKEAVAAVDFYRREVRMAERSLKQKKQELKKLRELREFIKKGKPAKPKGYGWTKLEEEQK